MLAFLLATPGFLAVVIGLVTFPLLRQDPRYLSGDAEVMHSLGSFVASTAALWGLVLLVGGGCGIAALFQKGRRKLLPALAVVPLGLAVVGALVGLLRGP